jgi:hypothetical protein
MSAEWREQSAWFFFGEDKKIKVHGRIFSPPFENYAKERERDQVWWGIYSAVANVGPHGMFKGDALLDDCDLINEYDNHDPNSSFECPRSYP